MLVGRRRRGHTVFTEALLSRESRVQYTMDGLLSCGNGRSTLAATNSSGFEATAHTFHTNYLLSAEKDMLSRLG